jgi:hypothetical protein
LTAATNTIVENGRHGPVAMYELRRAHRVRSGRWRRCRNGVATAILTLASLVPASAASRTPHHCQLCKARQRPGLVPSPHRRVPWISTLQTLSLVFFTSATGHKPRLN